jgi:hypothetical protein
MTTNQQHSMNYGEAIQQYRIVGADNATGDALRAMYAHVLVSVHGGDARTAARFYYPHLQRFATDEEVRAVGNALLADRNEAQAVIFNTSPTPNLLARRPEDQPEAAQEQSSRPATRGAAGAAGLSRTPMSPYREHENYYDRQESLARENEKPLFDGPGGFIAALILIFLLLLGLSVVLQAIGFRSSE